MRMIFRLAPALCGAVLASMACCGAARAGSFSTLYTFTGPDGSQPQGGLSTDGTLLYGSVPLTTSATGTVFSLSLSGQLTKLHDFTSKAGGGPNSVPLLLGKYLYGSADAGTAGSQGSDFRVATGGGGGVLYSFGEVSGDGTYPVGGLISSGKLLYGATSAGGTYGAGTIYSVTQSGKETVIYSFVGGSDGADPQGGLLALNGLFYGTTANGGYVNQCKQRYYRGCGTLFSVTPAGVKTILHTFQNGKDGGIPMATLISDGTSLFGTTSAGGPGSCAIAKNGACGTVFSVNLDGTNFQVLHSFSGDDDGAGPESPLIEIAGILYGTTPLGGPGGAGTIFSLDPVAKTETVLYGLSGDEGYPSSGLLSLSGSFYGETYGDGQQGLGTVYQFTP
jgi:uncharacterized repeat protein (TIGR03803 family)